MRLVERKVSHTFAIGEVAVAVAVAVQAGASARYPGGKAVARREEDAATHVQIQASMTGDTRSE